MNVVWVTETELRHWICVEALTLLSSGVSALATFKLLDPPVRLARQLPKLPPLSLSSVKCDQTGIESQSQVALL